MNNVPDFLLSPLSVSILLTVAVFGTWLFFRHIVRRSRIHAGLSEEQTAVPSEGQGPIGTGPTKPGIPRHVTGLFLALPFTVCFATVQITDFLALRRLDWHAQRQELAVWEIYGAIGSCLSLPFAFAGVVLVILGIILHPVTRSAQIAFGVLAGVWLILFGVMHYFDIPLTT